MQTQNDAPVITPAGFYAKSALDYEGDQKQQDSVVGVQDDAIERLHATALAVADFQRSLTFTQAVRRYPRAIMWCIAISVTLWFEAYDYNLVASMYGLPAFKEKYGERTAHGTYNVSAEWQTLLKQGSKIGQLFGLAFTGWAVDRIGYRYTQLIALAVMVPCVLFQFMAPSVQSLLGAQICVGAPVGVFLIISNMYALECAPLSIRHYLTSGVAVGWSIGGLISTGILRAFVDNKTEWAYRIPFAVQWAWIPPIVVICFIAPDSPVYLARRGRLVEAKAALRRLASSAETEQDLDDQIAHMVYTDALEKQNEDPTATYWDLFKGADRRRTEICCMVYSIENLCGFAIFNNGTYFFEQAGFSANNAFNLGLGASALSLVCNFLCWPCLRYAGRRTLYVTTLVITFALLLIMGGLGVPAISAGTAWATGGVCYLFTINNAVLLGPVCYTLIPEIPSNRLRAKTVALARMGYIFTAVFNATLTNYQINATAWNWRGKTGFFWAPFCLGCLIWCWFRLPETKHRSTAELDELFERRIPARKFKGTNLDAPIEGITA